MENQRCCHRKIDGFDFWPCRNRGKVERNGKFYCGVHDPVAVAEKRAARNVILKLQADARRAEIAREERAHRALKLLEATYPDDPIGNLERLIAADKEAGA